MNWGSYFATEQEFLGLVMDNKPISTKDFHGNVGVEVYCVALGKKVDAVYDACLGGIRLMNDSNPVFKDIPNRDLMLYNDFLTNENVTTIIVDGFFGTGKTSTVCSHLVPGLMSGKISSAYISKPHEPLGRTYGHLPGDIEEKAWKEFKSFIQYFDRFGQPMLAEKLMGLVPGQSGKPEPPVLEFLVFEYLRGLDIESGWVIIDEAQNTNKKEIVSFISRTCDKVKLIILGDSTVTQIDKKGNSSEDNGLVFAKKLFSGKNYAGVVELQTVKHILRGNRVRDLLLALKE